MKHLFFYTTDVPSRSTPTSVTATLGSEFMRFIDDTLSWIPWRDVAGSNSRLSFIDREGAAAAQGVFGGWLAMVEVAPVRVELSYVDTASRRWHRFADDRSQLLAELTNIVASLRLVHEGHGFLIHESPDFSLSA